MRSIFISTNQAQINIGGKNYISTRSASKLTGYTPDYIGQLARAGKVSSQLVGKMRFVEEDAILSHKENSQEKDYSHLTYFSYSHEEAPLMPEIKKYKQFYDKPQQRPESLGVLNNKKKNELTREELEVFYQAPKPQQGLGLDDHKKDNKWGALTGSAMALALGVFIFLQTFTIPMGTDLLGESVDMYGDSIAKVFETKELNRLAMVFDLHLGDSSLASVSESGGGFRGFFQRLSSRLKKFASNVSLVFFQPGENLEKRVRNVEEELLHRAEQKLHDLSKVENISGESKSASSPEKVTYVEKVVERAQPVYVESDEISNGLVGRVLGIEENIENIFKRLSRENKLVDRDRLERQIDVNESSGNSKNVFNRIVIRGGEISGVEISAGTSTFSGTFTGASGIFNDSLTVRGSLSALGGIDVNGNLSTTGGLSVPFFTATSTTESSSVAYRLGIGTTSPSHALSVSGTGHFTDAVTLGSTLDIAGILSGTTGDFSTFVRAPYFIATSTTATSTFAGSIDVGGDIIVGTTNTDALVVNSTIGSNLIPNSNAVFDLGSPSFYWDDAFVDSLAVNNISAASTTISGTQSETFSINSDNSTSDGEDASLVFFRGTVTPNAILRWSSPSDRFELTQDLLIQDETPGVGATSVTIKAGAGQGSDNLFNISDVSGNGLSVFSSSGHLGIGTTTPWKTLSVNGDLSLTGAFFDSSASSGSSGHVLQSTGTGLNWVATSTLGFITDLSSFDTDDLAEGSSLYFTNARARQAISSSATGLTYTSSTGDFSLTSGYNISLTASTTNWNNFYDTPSTRITAGDNLAWTGNSLAVTGLTSSQWTTSGSDIYYTAGNVGIGTITPATLLSLEGASPSVTLSNSTPGGQSYLLRNGVQSASSFDIFDSTENSSRFIIDGLGNIAIGSSTISEAKLFVYGGANVDIRAATNLENSTLEVQAHDFDTSFKSAYLQLVGSGIGGNAIDSIPNANLGRLAFQGADNALIYTINSAPLIFGTDFTERGRFTADGNFGIGTTSPTAKLSIETGADKGVLIGQFSTDPNYNVLSINGVNSLAGSMGLIGGASGDTNLYLSAGGGDLHFNLDSGTGLGRAVFTDGGNLGIGTTSPVAKLSVTGSGAGTAFQVADSANAPKFTIQDDGKVGIGTDTPSQQLEITQSFGLPATSDSSTGVIYQDDRPLLHTFGTSNTFVGDNSGNFTLSGSSNTGVGTGVLTFLSTGSRNTALGPGALPLVSSGADNIAVGVNTLLSLTTGQNNVAIGNQALQQTTGNGNVGIGQGAGVENTTGNYNVAVGYLAGPLSSGLTNATAIGANAKVGSSNSLVLGGTGSDSVNVGIGTTSPWKRLSVVGDISLTGGLYDNSATRGSSGHVLQSTGTGLNWVATSTLGFITNISSFDTDDLAEGSNLYYTEGRVQSELLDGNNTIFTNSTSTNATSTSLAVTGAFNFLGSVITDVAAWFNGLFDTRLATKDTDDLTEGSSLYFTDARARQAISSSATGLSYDNGTGIFSLSSGYNIPLTASTTNWNNFFDTPSTRITAGNNLAWTGNTLDVTGITSSQWTTSGSDIYYNSGNVGIGTTTPATKLHVHNNSVSNSVRFSDTAADANTGQSFLELGTHISGAFARTGYVGDGSGLLKTLDVWGNTGSILRFASNGSEVMRIDTSGNVGIGNTSPNSKLQVAGDMSTNPGTGSYSQLEVTGATDPTYRLALGYNTTGNYGVIQSLKNASAFTNLALNPNGGNVGIGTVSPNSMFHLNNASASATSTVRFTNATTGTAATDGFEIGIGSDNHVALWSWDNNALKFGTGQTERMRIDAVGNVGIGHTGPNVPLSINTGNSNGLQLSHSTAGFTNLDGFTIAHSAGDVFLNQRENAGMHFYTNNTQALTISSSGSVGIGTTSFTDPIAGTSKFRVVEGTMEMSFRDNSVGEGYLTLSNGTIKSLMQLNDTDGVVMGAFSNHSLQLRTNNTNRFTIDTSGNVGIGTTSPGQKLSVSGGNVEVSNTAAAAAYIANRTDGKALSLSAGSLAAAFRFDSSGDFKISSQPSSDLLAGNASNLTDIMFISGSAPANNLYVDAAGEVGLGTASPSSKLHISSSGSTQLRLEDSTDTEAWDVGITVNGSLLFQDQGTSNNILFQDGTGYVGINTTNPSSPLDIEAVSGNVNAGASTAALEIVSTSNVSGALAELKFGGKTNSIGASVGYRHVNGSSNTSGHLVFATRNSVTDADLTERMRIASDGNVGIGTGNPTAKLTLSNNVGTGALDNYSEYQMLLFDAAVAQNSYGIGIRSNTFAFNSASAYNFDTTGSTKVVFDSTGKIGAASLATATSNTLCYNTTAISGMNTLSTCSSSIRYKESVGDLKLGLEDLLKLQAREYDWIADGTHDLGFIAEEVEEVSPLLATYNKDGQIEGVKYRHMAALLVKAIQELNGKFEGFAGNIKDGVLKVAEVITDKVTAKTVKTDGIEMTDHATGDVYCVRIYQGEWNKTKGDCTQAIQTGVQTGQVIEYSGSTNTTEPIADVPEEVAGTTTTPIEEGSVEVATSTEPAVEEVVITETEPTVGNETQASVEASGEDASVDDPGAEASAEESVGSETAETPVE